MVANRDYVIGSFLCFLAHQKSYFQLWIPPRKKWWMQSGGSAPSLRIHTNRDELIAFPTVCKPIAHPFSDRKSLPEGLINVYSLEEVFAEKLRALSGQRVYAIARDIFDLHFLSGHELNFKEVLTRFPEKCRIKGIEVTPLALENFLRRKSEYRENWIRNLLYLIPLDLQIPFETAWNTTISYLAQAHYRN